MAELSLAAHAAPVPEMAAIRELFGQRRFADMLLAADALLKISPTDRDGLLAAAVAQRHLGKTAEALNTLAVIEGLYPRFSRLFQERGHCYIARKDAALAVNSFLHAVNINVALPASWRMLDGLYRMSGEADNAAMASSHVATLQRLDPEIVDATGLFFDGDLEPAEKVIRAYLLKHEDDIEGMRLLARIGIAQGIFDDAEILLEAVLDRAPNYDAARQEYAGVLLERHRYSQAQRELDRLLEKAPKSRLLRTLYATSSVGLGEHQRAIGLYQELLLEDPNDADLHLSLGHAQKTIGQREEGIASYRAAAGCRPDFGDAYWSLANLKTYRLSDDELASACSAEAAQSTQLVDRYHLCFALGKAFEDRAEFAKSYRYYERGNTLRRSESKYRPEIIETNTRQQIEVCVSEFFERRRDFGVAARDPIFIVGLPRSGSTLLEQILSSHSKVDGTQELDDVQQIVLKLQGRDADLNDPRYPKVMSQMTAEDFRRLANEYLTSTKTYRGERPFFVDKMPNNFRHIGLIHLMFPNAKIIDARRAPVACCLSNLKQLFAQGQEFTYGIEDIARYYRTYLELMRHWDSVLPGRILRVLHEDVVDDVEGSVRRLLNYCGLEFQPQCIEFYRTERSVRTASSEQVRQPIYRDGLDQWKKFEPWLAPLKSALGEALNGYRD